jgi:hypothetical protein
MRVDEQQQHQAHGLQIELPPSPTAAWQFSLTLQVFIHAQIMGFLSLVISMNGQ